MEYGMGRDKSKRILHLDACYFLAELEAGSGDISGLLFKSHFCWPCAQTNRGVLFSLSHPRRADESVKRLGDEGRVRDSA